MTLFYSISIPEFEDMVIKKAKPFLYEASILVSRDEQ